jgi:hypothetical protein
MTEEKFDSLMQSRPFGTKDAVRAEAQTHRRMRLLTTLGAALWAKLPTTCSVGCSRHILTLGL